MSISITNRCPLSCAHCITESVGLKERAGDLNGNVVEAVIRTLPSLSGTVQLISLTGGEPFLRLKEIVEISSAAQSASINTGVVTSAHWAGTSERAVATLRRVPAVSSLTLSHDLYHTKFVSIGNIRNAVGAAEKFGIKASIRVSIRENPSPLEAEHHCSLVSEFGDLVHKQSIVFFGRASNLTNTNSSTSYIPTLPCLSSGPHLSHSGRIFPCCSTITDRIANGHYLELDGADFSEAVSEARKNYYLSYIRSVGFEPLFQILPELKSVIALDGIANEGQCSLCARIAENSRAMQIIESFFGTVDGKAQAAILALSELGERDLVEDVMPHLKQLV